MKEKGHSEEKIHKMNVKVRRNKKLRTDPKHGEIIWGANDPSLYSFEERKRVDDGSPKKIYTVYSYNEERYGIKLKYPCMPIVFLGNNEWFPIEFLSQSFGKMKVSNSTDHENQKVQQQDQKDAVLDYYDNNSGNKYIQNVSGLLTAACKDMENIGLNYEQILKQYNLTKSSQPVKLEARVLSAPTLIFAQNKASIENGDWGVRKRRTGPERFKK